jgi:hypothetical protein
LLLSQIELCRIRDGLVRLDLDIPEAALGKVTIGGAQTSALRAGSVVPDDGPLSAVELETHPSTRSTSSTLIRYRPPILKAGNSPDLIRL